MRVLQAPAFKRTYKKLHPNQRLAVDEAVGYIIDHPQDGEEKKGDMAGIFVYKFKSLNQTCLLAYQWSADKRILLALGSHENFYRNLKR